MKFFIADPHYGHGPKSGNHGGIIKMMARVNPTTGALFSCQEEHDHYLLDRTNTLVSRDDELIIIGDFAWDKPGKYRAQIECKHVKLVLGNHDKKQASANVFGELPRDLFTRAYNKSGNDHIKLHCNHYPHAFWESSHKGWGHLYGHTHMQREIYLDEWEPERRALDVGVDNIYRLWGDYRPISEVEVFDYMAQRSGHDDVRYYKDFQQQLYLDRGLYGG